LRIALNAEDLRFTRKILTYKIPKKSPLSI